MSIFALSLFAALAQAQDVPAEQCEWNTRSTVAPVRPPDALATSRDFELCLVTLDIDGSGHPTSTKEVDSCPQVFAQAAIDAFVQWRFEPCVLENRPFEGEITLEAKFPSSEFQALAADKYQERIDQHEVLKPSGDACQVELSARTDGTITRRASNNPSHCQVASRRLPSQHSLKLKKQVVCDLSFTAAGTTVIIDDVGVSKCKDENVQRYARTAAAAFAWNTPIGGSEAYKVRMTLGPEK